MKVHARAAVTVTIAAAAIVAAAGCGASPKGAAPAPPASGSAASPGATASASPVSPGATGGSGGAAGAAGGTGQPPGRCHTSMLSAHIVMGQPGAGQRYAELVLTNTSGSTCRIYGYPGLQLLVVSGAHVTTAVVREPAAEPLAATAPGQQVSSLLHWTIVPGTGEGPSCEPTASGLIVTPPDETAPLYTSWPGGPVCQHGQIFVTAFQPGANAR
jgi:Protein of unknown function (DUF4232)